MKIKFNALEYNSDDSFSSVDIEFSGNTDSGWTIYRNAKIHLELGPGYRLMETRYCGICSTDLDRRYLPFPLPQIIGHEVIARDTETGEICTVEINDSCLAHGAKKQEIFCTSGLDTHCPERMVLGIDRLPGGFGPYILAPVNAIIPVDGIPEKSAVAIEPFGAALHAVMTSPPDKYSKVAVIGPGRLGLLIITALAAYRKENSLTFTITAIGRNDMRKDQSISCGADNFIIIDEITAKKQKERYELVYDATGSPSGLETALNLSLKEIHLKSTNGQEFHGIKHLTEFVVDELSLVPYSEEIIQIQRKKEKNKKYIIYLPPSIEKIPIPDNIEVFRGDIAAAEAFLQSERFYGMIPRFDAALAATAEEIDSIIRPSGKNEQSILKPKGEILFKGNSFNNPLLSFILKGKHLRSSRCGDLKAAIRLIKDNLQFSDAIEKDIITDVFPAKKLQEAFTRARSVNSIKTIISFV